ncbi:MAG: DnaJ domain-containing protein [Christensenellaceae bacterium]|nr:DnaJ domain-containing protein [Christensenellaceae bacterium]
MSNPFEVLGLGPTASAEEVRAAYRSLVKKCHPDMFPDAEARQKAQKKMIALNLAYEEAYHLASSRRVNTYTQTLPPDDAVHLAAKMLRQHSPESALRQLMRAETRDGRWYAMQGQILMQMEQFDSAHQSYREAVRQEPDNNAFRQGALDAALAMKQSRTLRGRVRQLLHRKQHR